ncbi:MULTISPECIES: WD40 repeat domain-containing protein [Streptosporangium]|uniref:WD40 repeat domain-containing protein n=1 Tax=Streptosporangium brasiliense TaxID=47480 RepID=A0ABT9QVQ3_9ACTN|nr:hypothetical protein [Streptosporangium brasiliense]MDP9861053.1 hypothetical protein [Streptosporangium brasiliense]
MTERASGTVERNDKSSKRLAVVGVVLGIIGTIFGAIGAAAAVVVVPDARVFLGLPTEVGTPLPSNAIGHTASVWSVAFSPDGRTLATGSRDSMVRLWDVTSKESIATLTGHASNVISLAFRERSGFGSIAGRGF